MALVPRSTGSGVFRRPDPDPVLAPATTETEDLRNQGAARAFRAMREREIRQDEQARLAMKTPPEQAGRALTLSRYTGLPSDTALRQADELEMRKWGESAVRFMDRNPARRSFFRDPLRLAASRDDFETLDNVTTRVEAARPSPVSDAQVDEAYQQKEAARIRARDAQFELSRRGNSWLPQYQAAQRDASVATANYNRLRAARDADRGGDFWDRMGYMFRAGVSSTMAGLDEALGALLPSSWSVLSKEQGGTEAQRQTVRDWRASAFNPAPIRGGTTWEDLKARPTPGRLFGFVTEQGAQSIPGMFTAVAAAPVYGLSLSGQIANNRAQANGRSSATAGDVLAAAPFAVVSAVLEKVGANKVLFPVGKTALGRVASAGAAEGSTEFLQSVVEYTGGSIGTDRGFKAGEAIDQGFAGFVAGSGLGAGLRGSVELPRPIVERAFGMIQARTGESFLDGIFEQAKTSKLRTRNPSLFAEFLQAHADGTAVENLYIPAEALRQLYQQNGWDWTDDGDDNFGSFTPDFKDQMEAGLASGGDVVVPMAQAAAYLAGTPEWDAIKGDVRVNAGSLSPNEATSFEEAWAAEIDALAERAAKDAREEADAAAPRQKVFDQVFSWAREAGFSINASRAYADLWGERYQTRAERLGGSKDAWALFSESVAGIRQDLPGSVRETYKRGDGLDVLITAMRNSAQPMQPAGLSLLDRIMEGGGIEDVGGDIRHMGGDKIALGDGRFGRRRKPLIREATDDIGDMAGNSLTPDDWALRLWEEGYFPDQYERPSVNMLLDAIGEGLAGEHRYAEGSITPAVEANNSIVQAADDLRNVLFNAGLDPETATRAEIEAAIQAYQDESYRSLDQFAGPQAETANLHALQTARDMLAQGRSPELVRQETGWFRGVDLRWRFEISDEDAVVVEAALPDLGGGEGKEAAWKAPGGPKSPWSLTTELGEVLLHDRLYAAYPDLRTVAVLFRSRGEAKGSVDPFGLTIEINPDKATGPDDIRSTLLHEVQHLIQRREGFARGGNTSWSNEIKRALAVYAGEWQKKAETTREALQERVATADETSSLLSAFYMFESYEQLMRYANSARPSGQLRHIRGNTSWLYSETIRNDPDLSARAADLQRSFYAMPKRHKMAERNRWLSDHAFQLAQLLKDAIGPETFARFRDDPRQLKSVGRALENAARKARKGVEPIQKAESAALRAKGLYERTEFKTPFEVYLALAGEAEARNTQARADLTEAERLATPPDRTADIPEDDMIVVFQDGEIAAPFLANVESLSIEGGRSLFQGAALPETIEIDGVQRSTVNSDGQPLAQDEAGVRNFWAWFGDSKVVDAAGRPLVVYHGTAADFQSFKMDGFSASGAYFTDNPDLALDYANDAELNGYNPDDQAKVVAAYLSIQAPNEVDGSSGQYDAGFGIDDVAFDGASDGAIIRNVSDNITEDRGRNTSFVVVDPAQIKSVDNRGTFDRADPRILFQGSEAGSRGRIDFLADNRAMITLMEGRDLSTLLHEGGHLWLEELRADALSMASGKVFGDWETVKAWFKREGIEVGDVGDIPTEAHELWARGMERYFMEGKAPSSVLESAFSSFRAWLLRIYQLVTRLGSNIDNDVRKVFDRMIATDEAIAWAVHEADEKALFDSAAAANMTPHEFKAYRDLLEASRTEAFDAVLYRTMERIRRERTKEYQDERARVRLEIAEEVAARPEFVALDLIRGRGEEYLPLNRMSLIEVIGRDAIGALPRGRPGFPTVVDGGASVDLVAERAGFPDGKTLAEALLGIERRHRELVAMGDGRTVLDEAIDVETEAAMAERHPDIMDDGTIEAEALEAINTASKAERLAQEVRQLAKSIDANPAPLDVVKSWAERVVREGRIVDQATGAAVDRHHRAEKSAARSAERAYLGGDYETAFREKQKQLVANALYRASRDARDNVEVIARRLDRLARSRGIKGMDPEYLDQIHGLLEQYDLRRRSAADIRERESFDRWAKKQEELGIEVFVPERLTMAGNVNFTRMRYEDLVALDDAVQSLAHLGREKNRLKLAKEERDLEALIEEAETAALGLPMRPWSPDRNPEPSKLRGLDALLTKIEFLADQLDNGNPNGVFNRVLVQEATRAANEKERLFNAVVDPLAKLYLEAPKAQQKRWGQRVAVPEFVSIDPETKTLQPTTFLRSELIAVALNVGNASNLEKMLAGETMALPELQREANAWTEEKVMSVLARELDADDWKFVEKVWEQVNMLWPDIVRAEREITGVTPEKIEGRTVETPYGPIKGGYYPIVYDQLRSQVAADNADGDAAKLLGQIGRSVGTPKGHTITRTSAAMPITFSLERVLFNHVNRVTTRIAYGRYVRDVLKFISHPKIRRLVDQHVGLEYYRQLKPWLQRQVNEAALDTNTMAALDRIFRKFRVNAQMVWMGFRVTTMISQIAGWSVSAKEIGVDYLLKGMRETARNMGEIRGWVFEQSPEMASRAQAFDRDVRAFYLDARSSGRREGKTLLDRIARANHAAGLDKVRAAAFWGIGMIDVYLVSMPTWVGAYHKGIDQGFSVDEARAYADKAVRRSQGAGRSKDLAPIQDGGEAYRILTLAYSFFSVQYNQQREAIHAARAGDWRRAAMNVFWLMMVGPLAGALLTGDWPDEEDRDIDAWVAWAMRKVFFGMWSGVPVLRDISAKAEREISGKFAGEIQAPIYEAFSQIERPIGNAVRLAKGDEVSERWLRDTITPLGYFLGLPTGQVGTTAQYVYDVSEGNQDPESVGDVAIGLAKGPQKDQE